ncbi:MAG: hypothetical protein GX633_08055 [Clostridiales bacterium]|nr:hypothetical protein [Clostridiales bacterium]
MKINLNGVWETVYSEIRPESTHEIPDFKISYKNDLVPGYWEDMYPLLQMAPWWEKVTFNPEFRPLRYPMTGVVPDMVLHTMVGTLWYKRNAFVPEGGCAYFTCTGVQNRALLWVNNAFAGEHNGYSTSFEIDITELVRFGGENEIVLAVSNHNAYNETGELISGCTSRAANRFTGGIIGDTCIVVKDVCHITDAYIRDCREEFFTAAVETKGDFDLILWEILDNGEILRTGESSTPEITIDRESLLLWSPESPKIYRMTLKLSSQGRVTDEYAFDFGLRRVETSGYSIMLNSEIIYLRGICEHGYFAKTVHPDPDINYYINAIRTIKELGFNFIRFHTWIPTEEYMTAADRLGMLLHVESPNNTTKAEWADIMRFVRRHPSVIICCCGNELLIDDGFLSHLERCADISHSLAPMLLFSPMNAIRGIEYYWAEKHLEHELKHEPFTHNPRRLKRLQECSDIFSSYALGHVSYDSVKGDMAAVDSWAEIYKLPRITHEICIHGTYIDLDLENRYEDTRIGESELYSSVRSMMKREGVLDRAPVYYNNSCRWQMLLRKHCFENVRLCGTIAGYDYLGDIDHHWHTFGYRAGMMNEFYELKPHESVENVRKYNSESVLLCDLGTDRRFLEGENIKIKFLVSHYGKNNLKNAVLDVRLETRDRKIILRKSFSAAAKKGGLRELAALEFTAPHTKKLSSLRVFARLSDDKHEIINDWNIWVFPKTTEPAHSIIVTEDLSEDIMNRLESGADVLLLGTGPFKSNPLSFRMSLAGRTAGNLATVIENHPLNETFEHDTSCGWQFMSLMEDAKCLYYPPETEVPFEPVIEVVSSYKWIRRQAAVCEMKVGKGRLLISTFNVRREDVSSLWWKNNLLCYITGRKFDPKTNVSLENLRTLFYDSTSAAGSENNNIAKNPNDKTMK